ncbi:MAG: low-specificity L-threonine aldolase [Proteobacteria bacterium]|nr:low-specificity L-threonine aldolase [Pseudomonadota bacterium]
MIDLRSDTVTKPTDAMRDAMARADVGDDVYGEDPTINALQQRVADMLGHEAGLWVPSGTMGNAVCLATWLQRGDEVIAEAQSHIFEHEVGGVGALCGSLVRPIATPDGIMQLDQVRDAVRLPDDHHTITRVITLENTHNFSGGTVLPLDVMHDISAFGRDAGIAMHLDGARLWNAHAETGIALDAYGRLFDSAYVCLSKGLGAPGGSVVVGTRAFIARARRTRKMLGGGMRQVGVLAAAGLHALEHHLPRLREDHENARALARQCCEIPGVRLAQRAVETNIVFFDVSGTGRAAIDIERALQTLGVGVFATAATKIRAVTHLQISRDDVARAAAAFAAACAGDPALPTR